MTTSRRSTCGLRLFVRLLSFYVLATIPLFASAQTTKNASSAESDPVSSPTESVQEFRRLLSDPDIQNWLQTAPLDPDNNNLSAQPTLRENMLDLSKHVRTRISNLSNAMTTVRSAPVVFLNGWRSQVSESESLRVISYIVIFLFLGAAIEWLYTQYTHFRLLALELKKPDNLRERLSTASYRALLTFGSLFAFAAGSIGAFLTFDWPGVVDDLVLDILIIVLVVRVVSTLSRFFLAPHVKELRLVPLNNSQARSLHLWIVVIAFVGITKSAVSSSFENITSVTTGLSQAPTVLIIAFLANLVWLASILLAIAVIHRLFVRTKTLGNGKFASTWPVYLGALAVAVFVFWLIDTPDLMWTILIFGLLFPVTTLCRNWVDNLFDQAEKIDTLHGDPGVTETPIEGAPVNPESTTSPSDVVEEKPLDDGTEAADDTGYTDLHGYTVQTYEAYRPITRRIVRFLLVISAFAALATAWSINIFTLSSSQTPIGSLFKVIIDVVIVLLIADLIWVWARSAIDRRLAAYVPPVDNQAPGPEARMATLLPLLRTMLVVTLLTMVSMSILSAFGVNIGPLLAGAGVVGVAIGFGAQALVRDVVSGIFFLIDDAFRVGEYIETAGLMGTVDSMSIRSLRIRHHRGAVHTVPFGELKALTNYSRDWVIMKLEFRVPFDTDLKLVKKLVKNIGAELQQNPDYGHSIIQPLKSQGVRRMEEFNMVVGVKFTAKPGEQWVIRRDAFQKVRDAFDSNGITFAERNVKVEVVSAKPLDEATEKAVSGAALQMLEQPGSPKPIPDEP